MIVYPNAKINLGLSICSKRADGFHDIESIFYPVNICDILEIISQKDSRIRKPYFSSSGIPIPGNTEKNLCIQAYQLVEKDFGIPAVKIHLHKQIPIGAGLGGGSSDAAFVLKGLNELFQLSLSGEQLKKYAAQLGSDCAFFIENTPTYNYHKGDEYECVSLDLSCYYLAVLFPDIHISTAEAYAGVVPAPAQYSVKGHLDIPINRWKHSLFNDFEASLFPKYPELEKLKSALYAAGAVYASMTGSGSAVYGIFDKEVDLTATSLPVIWSGKLR